MGLTAEDRNFIEYHPVLKYVHEEITAPEYIENSNKIEEIAENLSSNTLLDMINLYSEIVELIETIEEKYANGIEGSVKDITFLDYKNALKNINFENRVLVNEYEEYQAGPAGNIELEVYPILIELKEEWEENLEFFRQSTLFQIDKKFPEIINVDSQEFQNYCDLEIREVEQLHNLYKEKEQAYLEEDIDKYNKLVHEVITKEDRINTKLESVENMKYKISNTSKVLSVAERLISNPAATYIVPTGISTRSMAANYRTVIDNENRNIQDLLSERNIIAGKEARRSLNRNLVIATHLYNESIRPTARQIAQIENIGTNPMIKALVKGIKINTNKYEMLLESSYVLDEASKQNMYKQLRAIEEKNATRLFYNIVNGGEK